ncbi:hypothetical protein PR048_020217 [Dryococelus australis]|uniref:Reverse transcriptase n=1 Tax=Dryococelus australis TaxID=614101 RepID=A0ABQ9H5Q1_9NEOP|nr:hypothetical protein PR048_020217 [Dryococelus australis]
MEKLTTPEIETHQGYVYNGRDKYDIIADSLEEKFFLNKAYDPIILQELFKIIKTRPCNKFGGPDGIKYEALKI